MTVVGETIVRVRALVDQQAVKRDVRAGVTGGLRGVFGSGSAGALLKGAGIASIGTALAIEIRKSVREATDAAKIQANLKNAVDSTGQSFERYRGFIEDAIDAQSKLSAFDDEELSQTFSNLVRRTGDVSEALRLNALAADISRGANRPLVSVAVAVGKAADGQAAALQRLGIQVRKGVSGVEALNDASRKYAGAAATYGDSSAGSFDKLKKTVGDLREEVGGPLTVALAAAADATVLLLDPVVDFTHAANEQAAKHPGIVDGLKDVFKWSTAVRSPLLGAALAYRKLREEAEKPISPATDSLLSAGRREDLLAGSSPSAGTSAPTRLGAKTRLELQLRAAERRDDLQEQLRIARELLDIAAKRVAIVKTVGPLLAKRKEELEDARDRIDAIQDQIDANEEEAARLADQKAQDARDAAAQRKQDAIDARKEAARLAAEELRQDLSDTEQSLQNNLARAKLTTKRLDDDRKALRALLAFYRQARKTKGLERSERLAFERSIIDTRGELASLGKTGASASSGATTTDFFTSAIQNLRSFGSNVAGRGGVLSAQDERASFAFEALRRLKNGKGLSLIPGFDTSGGGGNTLDKAVKDASVAQVTQQKITNQILLSIATGLKGGTPPPRKPKTDGGLGFAESAALGLLGTGA